MNELVKDILEFYEVTPSAYIKCPDCDQEQEATLEKAPKKLQQSTLPWVLFFKDIYRLRSFACCGQTLYPTHIRLRPKTPVLINPEIEEMLFSEEHLYQIGTIKVPVIADELQIFPITRTYEEQLAIQKQLEQQTRLLERKQKEFYDLCYSYFSIHFEKIIQEIDGEEMLDVFDAMMDTTYGLHLKNSKTSMKKNKKDKKAHLNWVKKQIRQFVENNDEQGKQIVFYLIVKYFVEWELIQGVYYLRWNIEKYKKMIGNTLLLYMVMQFPLTKHFSYLREDALHKLIPKRNASLKKYDAIDIAQKDLEKANTKLEKLQQTIDRQRETIMVLENKLEAIESKNYQLNKELQVKEEPPNLIMQTKKIKGLKSIIESMRYELQTLRYETVQTEDLSEEVETNENDLLTRNRKAGNGDKDTLKIDPSILKGKKIGIFGDIQIPQEPVEVYACEVVHANSVQSVEGQSVMNKSEALVVLTQHISHACMWAIKEYASNQGKPVLYTRHTNVKIILDQVANILMKNNNHCDGTSY